ncbi:hypothetical protein NDR87_09140 [Nocardia sp. CDC159]|uniref:ABC transporter permease n=1 Tax=Nocardia pulmonis TaxID=2951408 RepID=A0A9X2IV89_9NOCA|nr:MULTISPECIES: hypothetical protein [Nocardia]MCM6773632.1 hypothetical protein [Nocardia pulmonis]MCM6786519.1 hypothetical protein [Nocardia sp. CDC159]
MNATSRAVAVGLAAAVLQAVLLIAFAWPAANLKPRDLPIVVAGPQAGMVEERLVQREPEAFEIATVADEAAARAAIERRDAYGAIVTGGGQPRVLIASAASPVVAQLITQLGQQLLGASAAPVQDVVAADPDDPRGAGFGAMVLPLVMAGLAAGVLLSLLVPSVAGRALGLLAFGIVAGPLSMAIVQGWLALLPGSFLALAAIAGLVSFTVAGTVVGLAALLGHPGIGLAALLLLLIGNPFSAATSAPELLPEPWGAIGQLLPPGAAATLLRSVAFFDGHAVATPLIVLFTWAAAAVALLAVTALRPRIAAPQPVPA